jgi:hypothetical protein
MVESQLADTMIKAWGVYGVILIVLAGVVVMLWRHTVKQQDQLIDLQNLRVTEAKDVRAEMMAYSQKSNEALGNLTMVISSLKDAVQVMSLKRESRSER